MKAIRREGTLSVSMTLAELLRSLHGILNELLSSGFTQKRFDLVQFLQANHWIACGHSGYLNTCHVGVL